MKVINLFGGPGAGKSTTAAGVFWLLKNRGLRVELVTEYAKALAWAKRGEELSDQFYIYAKQHHRQHVLKGQVDFCVTDSPLLLPLLYNKTEPASFRQYVIDNWYRYDNINFFIQRVKPYIALGRWQTEEEANQLGQETLKMLYGLDIMPMMVLGDTTSATQIIQSLEIGGYLECSSY
jgi:tRNA uridine 5-carbamoylmethylation protein Kti12